MTIITPCYKAKRYIRETQDSAIAHTAGVSSRAPLEYIICGGDSSFSARDIVESYRNDVIKLFSGKDRRIHDALSKGLQDAIGETVAYLNAVDFYYLHAFDNVFDLFESKRVRWLTECMVIYNESSQITYCKLPFKYRKNLLSRRMNGRYLHAVQQESTFLSSSLNSLLALDALKWLSYVSDIYRWLWFSAETELNIVESYLGGFNYHYEQLSENYDAYIQ